MKLLLTGIAAVSVLSASAAYAADESDPPLPASGPGSRSGSAMTFRDPFSIEYDLGGTIWGGSRFTVIKGELYFNARPCLPLRPVGY